MKFSDAWLREWVNPDLSPKLMGERLTMAGLEMDSITDATLEFTEVLVAEVIHVAPVEDSDHLKLCKVSTGGDELIQIVCGASNVHTGLRTALAKVGAVLPDGTRIKRAKLRGNESFGMLCSAKELGLSEDATGLLELPMDAPVGMNVRDYLQLDDQVLEVDLTPNRADCLSIQGIAREVSALTGSNMLPHEFLDVPEVSSRIINVELVAAACCPIYVGRVIEGINLSATTPLWIQERLRRSGIRRISPIVDITNYVMLELGQPIHAFDLDQLNGGIRVRMAELNEKITLLDGQTVELDDSTLVISDHSQALAIAGIMGGEGSSVGAATENIFLESAWFAPQEIAGHARKYGLHTESSHRFERGVDPKIQRLAVARTTSLLLEITGGRPGPVIEVRSNEHIKSQPVILLHLHTINRLLGVDFTMEKVESILSALQCEVTLVETGSWQVKPPSYRFDLNIEVDLVEEIARVYGYDNIPDTISEQKLQIEVQPETAISLNRIRHLLVDKGYQEVITYSFVDPQWEYMFNPGHQARVLSNPISRELAVMRSNLWPGLVKSIQYNLNRQQSRVRLFESGLIFRNTPSGLEQVNMLSAAVTGARTAGKWCESSENVDFFDIKGDVESLFRLGNKALDIQYTNEVIATLHSGQAATIKRDDRVIGRIGRLHPSIEKTLGLDQPIYLFELELNELFAAALPTFTGISRYPAIRRDIAVLVNREITAAQIKACITAENITQLKEFEIFDVYTGKGVSSARKSIALGLILQDFSRTLNDEEVDHIQTRIINRLQDTLQATLRV